MKKRTSPQDAEETKNRSTAPKSKAETSDKDFFLTLTVGSHSYQVKGPFKPNKNEPLSVPMEICEAVNALDPEFIKTKALFTLDAGGKTSQRMVLPLQAKRYINSKIAAVQLAKGLYMGLK